MSGRHRSGTGTRRARATGVLLLALVILPGLVLGWMALRATDREEAVVEKQLRTTLLAEVTPAANRIAVLLETLAAELARTAPDSAAVASAVGGDETVAPRTRPPVLDAWASASPLVATPFLFQRTEGRFLWPTPRSPYLAPTDAEFLDLNLEFFQDRRSVELLSNAALEFADEPAVKELLEIEGTAPSAALLKQQALSEFERSEEFRQRVYDEARRSGRSVPEPKGADLDLYPAKSKTGSNESSRRGSRSEADAFKKGVKAESMDPPPSPFVTESLRFSEIVANADQGWIPRLVDERLLLLYWRKLPGGRIVGCEVGEEVLRERILEELPVALSPARVLTVLDHTGRPLFDPDPEMQTDWRVPFVSREISEHLPRWEVAAYLADPEVISDQARTRALAVWLLVGVLVVSIMTGGFVVSRLLRSELRLAEQKTTFVANVSHELKTPLTSIRLLSEMLRDGRQKDPEKQRKYLDIVVSETERLTRLINNVLDFSRANREGRHYSRREVDLVELCRELVETQMVRLGHAGFTVESSFLEGEAWSEVDPESIKQALLNLVSNAEKYSPKAKWIRIEARREGGSAILSVADHGIGIQPRDAARIFDEFYRADDSLTASVRGTGLGLTLSRRILEDHGGSLLYRPNTPAGSVFEARLPLLEGAGRPLQDGEADRPRHRELTS